MTFLAELPANLRKGLVVPAIYTTADRAELFTVNYVSVIAQRKVLDALNAADTFQQVQSVELGTHVDESHIDFAAEPAKEKDMLAFLPEDSVIMAVIDDGIAVAHNLFRDAQTSSRILHAELFGVTPDLKAGNASYGRKLAKGDIDALLKSHTKGGLLQEQKFYEATGQIDYFSETYSPISQRRSHGTHVTALAAGYPMDAQVANRPIICAALPAIVTYDVTGQTMLPSLALALHSVSNNARKYSREESLEPPPVVLNFSYGNTSGPHDGTDETSQLLEWYQARHKDQKTWITLPVGNDNLSQTHALLAFGSKKKPRDLTMVLLPDDRTASHVDFWVPYGADFAGLRLGVTTPCGHVNTALDAVDGAREPLCDKTGCVVGEISFSHRPLPTDRGVFSVSLHPTFALSSDQALAPARSLEI